MYTKNVPNIEVMKLYPWPAQKSAFQASHSGALLIGCMTFCTRLYIGAPDGKIFARKSCNDEILALFFIKIEFKIILLNIVVF